MLDKYKYLRYTKNFKWAHFLKEKGVPISDFTTNNKSNSVYIRSVDKYFVFGEYPLFFDAYRKYYWKFTDNGFKFKFENGSIFIGFNGLNLHVENLEEFFIISEVFIENTYQLETTGEFILFDIGMNVGITSLYFSQYDNIKRIYGFEPFEETFTCATKNFGLNKIHSSKIESFNYGLGGEDKKLQMLYDSANKGNVGIKNSQMANVFLSSHEIVLKRASSVFKKYIDSNPGNNFIAKIDCEGSEYDILEDLATQNLLSQFSVFMIEWHKLEGYAPRLKKVIETMKESNFIVKAVGSFQGETGMLYCFKIS